MVINSSLLVYIENGGIGTHKGSISKYKIVLAKEKHTLEKNLRDAHLLMMLNP